MSGQGLGIFGDEIGHDAGLPPRLARRQQRRLRCGDEGAQLNEIDSPRPIIGLRIAEKPTKDYSSSENPPLSGSVPVVGRWAPRHVSDGEGLQPFSDVFVFMQP